MKKRRVKWEPAAAMVGLLLLGVWVVIGPAVRYADKRDNAQLIPFRFAGTRGALETVKAEDDTYSFRLLWRNGDASDIISADDFKAIYGEARYERAVSSSGNLWFRLLNITNWAGVVWVAIGFAGQTAFFGRMFIQWIVSERRRESVVPDAFWYLSLVGGVMLFTYFVWRQDIVGVLGQSSGVVIYARNIRLIYKRRRRERRAEQGKTPEQPADT